MILFFAVMSNVVFFCKRNKSVSGFTICEDFVRLNRLKCVAPKFLQAKREHNRLEQIVNPLRAFFQNLKKKSTFNNALYLPDEFLHDKKNTETIAKIKT